MATNTEIKLHMLNCLRFIFRNLLDLNIKPKVLLTNNLFLLCLVFIPSIVMINFKIVDKFIGYEEAMPRIDNDIKLDFKDVLIRPKRSTLKSRADVDLTREFIFRHSKKTYEGIPIIASNMDTVGTFDMAIQLSKVF